jgi:hypothetical protein
MKYLKNNQIKEMLKMLAQIGRIFTIQKLTIVC